MKRLFGLVGLVFGAALLVPGTAAAYNGYGYHNTWNTWNTTNNYFYGPNFAGASVDVMIDNDQTNSASGSAFLHLDGHMSAGDDAAASAVSAGNMLSISSSSSGTSVGLANSQFNSGDQIADADISAGIHAGDDAAASAVAVGNSATVTIGGLDL